VSRSARLSGTFIVVTTLSVALSSSADEPRQQDALPIDSGTAIERSVAIGEEHHYTLTLTAGECAEVLVEQRGIDVVVRVLRAGSNDVVEVQEDVRRDGRELVTVVAPEAGIYTLAVSPSHGVYSGSYAIRVVTRRVATESDRSMFEARRLRTVALDQTRAARFGDARLALEQSISITEARRGPDDVFVGILLHDLVAGLLSTRDFTQAERIQRRALAIFDRSWGDGHPYSAMARLRLGVLLLYAGQRGQAETTIAAATQAIEKTVGTEHSWYAACLRAEASLRFNARDLDAAERVYLRAKATLERIRDDESASYTAVLNNLGLVYQEKGDLPRAEAHYRRALALTELLEGPDGYNISLYLQNLSTIARERKDYNTALAYATRALAIRQAYGGPDHVDMAPLLSNLAIVYRKLGVIPQAIEMFLRSFRLVERVVGPYHGNTLTAVGNVALVYWDTGEVAKAIPYQRRADAIVEKQLELNLAVGSERQKLAFVRSIAERTDRTLSMHLRAAPGDPDASTLAALVVLQRKGRVLDAMTDAFAAGRRLDDSHVRNVLNQWNSATSRLARLAFTTTEAVTPEERQRSIKALEIEKERLEAELSQYGELRAQVQPVTLETVQAAIPEDAALLEFAVFRPFDPTAELPNTEFGPPHYAAYVLHKSGRPLGIDLGPTAEINAAIDALRQALRDRSRTDVKARARTVYDLVMRPLQSLYGDASRLLVSPDGGLNLVPFDALVDDEGRYLIERHSISYLTSGRDLLRMQVPRTPRNHPVIVADPRYGEPAPTAGVATRSKPLESGGQPAARATGIDSSLYFPALANTAEEARIIKRFFPAATLLTGHQASKAAFAQLDAPRMLHIASHGFFLEDRTGPSADSSTAVQNPLLRSGIALAGANRAGHGRGNGILTALEASGLNLWGTKLVTLSACDTGIGEVSNGEGVYGLRRAFLLAGTETLVMSLWPLSDYMARETMVAYYAGLRAGVGRGEALRQAKVSILRRKGREHPFYWASFIQSGEWANLDGMR
jgi:CHAT domain-containing protein